jgi:hypothetical protein
MRLLEEAAFFSFLPNCCKIHSQRFFDRDNYGFMRLLEEAAFFYEGSGSP